MRIIDLHCYPGTQAWIDSQGPYVEALATYWKRGWTAKQEDAVIAEFTEAGIEACLVALDLETTVATPPCTNDYVHAMWRRHPERVIQCWGTLDPFKGELAMREARKAVTELGFMGFHFHPIMQHFAVNDRRFYPLFELIDELVRCAENSGSQPRVPRKTAVWAVSSVPAGVIATPKSRPALAAEISPSSTSSSTFAGSRAKASP